MAALDRDDTQSAQDLRVDDVDHGRGIEPGERALRGGAVELDTARQALRQPSQREVRIRDGRLRPAASVARRAGIGAGALWSDPQRPTPITPDDRAAAGTHRMQVDRGKTDRKPVDGALGRPLRAAAQGDADVRGRPTHVERDRILDRGEPRDPRSADDSGRRARDENRRRMGRSFRGRRDPSRRAHDKRLGQSGRDSRIAERIEVARDDRPEICVHNGCRGTLVLAELRGDLVRGDDVCVRQAPPQLRDHGSLLRRVAVRVQETDCDGIGVDRG